MIRLSPTTVKLGPDEMSAYWFWSSLLDQGFTISDAVTRVHALYGTKLSAAFYAWLGT